MSEPSIFGPVDGGRLSGRVVSQVVTLIRSGRLAEGDRLPPERELAATMGISRVTLRDALRVLEVMGLITIRVGSGGGAFITVPAPEVIGEILFNLLTMSSFSHDEIAEARHILELGILSLVVDRVTTDDIDALRRICAQSRDRLLAGAYEPELSIEFHARLAQAAHNDAITMIAKSFSGPLSMAAIRSRGSRDDLRTITEHEQIVVALEEQDRQQASRLMTAHLLRNESIDILSS